MKKKVVDTGQSRPDPGPNEKNNGNQEGVATGTEGLEERIIDEPRDLVSPPEGKDEASEEIISDAEQSPVSTEGAAEPQAREAVTEQAATKEKFEVATIEIAGSGYEKVFSGKLLFSNLLKTGGQKTEKIWDTPLREIAEFLKQSGVPQAHLNEALISVVGFSSALHGYPLHLVYTEDEGALGGELLNLCRDISPTEGIVDFLEIPDASQYSLKGKTIFLPDCSAKDKRLKAFSLLLDNNRAIFQDHFKGGREIGIGSELDGPVGLVAFVKDARSEIVHLPFVTHFHIPLPMVSAAERITQEESGFRSNSDEFRLNRGYVSALLSRPEPREVVVPFYHQMLKSVQRIETARFLTSGLKVITILNHFEPPSIEEILLKFMNNEAGGKIERSSAVSNLPMATGDISSRQPLMTTIYDYYCFKTLVDARISNGREGLTQRQNRVFEAIKVMNLDYLKPLGLKRSEILETLEHPSHVIKGWQEIRKIHEKVNQGQEDKFSVATLNKEVEVLLDRGVIQRSKIGNNPVKYVYAIQVLTVESSFVTLPNPRDLYDTSSSGPIRGRNPLTGKVEEI